VVGGLETKSPLGFTNRKEIGKEVVMVCGDKDSHGRYQV